MATRRKRSISLSPEIDEAAEAAAREEGSTYSGWVNEVIRKELIIRNGLAGVAEYEAEFGAFTDAERAEARAWALDALARAKRTGDPIGESA